MTAKYIDGLPDFAGTLGNAYAVVRYNGVSYRVLVSAISSGATETDPVFTAHAAANVTTAKLGNWDTAFSWGNHASGGYLTSAAIGASVQAYDADLTTWAGKTAPSGTVLGTSDTQTLTNKRVTARVGSTTSHATPTINTDNVDIYKLTAQAEAITSMTTNLSGTPSDGDCLIVEITGTAARAITWGASFEASTVALPTTTVTTAMLAVAFIYNSVSSKWRCVAAV